MSSSFKEKRLSLTEPRPRIFARAHQSNLRHGSDLFKKFVNRFQAQERKRYNRQQEEKPEPKQNVENPLRISLGSSVSWNYIIVFCLFFLLLLFLCFYFYTSNSCMKDYQLLECWKDEMSLTSKCLALEACMKEEESQDKIEYLVTAGAACVLIIKKYQREILRIILNMRERII